MNTIMATWSVDDGQRQTHSMLGQTKDVRSNLNGLLDAFRGWQVLKRRVTLLVGFLL